MKYFDSKTKTKFLEEVNSSATNDYNEHAED